MCGIAGIVGLTAADTTVKKMLATMKRRGPDESGIYQNDDITMLHSRLAIIDFCKGKQPMHFTWANEMYTLIYNGELYNTSELRSELQSNGHTFHGYSDTEIVLHAYAHWGSACLDKMNGIYGFAIWEHKQKRLFIARDRIGVKPLFYTQHKDGLIFASEIKSILAYPGVNARLDSQGVMQLIMLGPGRLPGNGIFHNIYEIEPGYYGYYESGKLFCSQYWKLRDCEHMDSFDETIEKVKFLVTDAIQRQMISDVPIGTFLSGGLDSSIISAVCAKEIYCRGEALQTFSVDYKNNSKYFSPNIFQPNSDSHYINIMASYLNSDHFETVLSAEDLLNSLESATIARDLPGMADVDFSLLAFCKEIRNHVKVALSGECADEIFGGYPWYRDPKIRTAEGFPWSQNITLRANILSKQISENSHNYVMDAYRKTCLDSDILPTNSPMEWRMKEMVNLNFRWFMQTLLDRKDRMSMYQSLEVRVPFCDHRIAEYLYSVPWEYKDHGGREKGLLRKAMEGILPDSILYRKKSPYPKTFDPQYENAVRSKLQSIIQNRNSPLWYVVDRDAILSLIENDMSLPWYGQLMRRPQTMAYLLQINFWLEYYQIDMLY